MIFGIIEKCIILTHTMLLYGYCYKLNTCAAYDCFCAPGTHVTPEDILNTIHIDNFYEPVCPF